MKEIRLQEIKGFRFGHAQNDDALTGCSVIICEKGAIGGVEVRGGAPGTRETDALHPENLVEEVHGIFLSGGSAFGLDVGSGMMQLLEEKSIGFDVQVTKVPIVAGAILFDLYPGDPVVRPDSKMGYEACTQAYLDKTFSQGSVGAGTGATVGKCLGYDFVMRGGIGSYALEIGELQIGAVVVVNAFGDIIDPTTNQIVAGAYDRLNGTFLKSDEQMLAQLENKPTNRFSGNTTIGSIVTNAKLTKSQANKIASIAHDGFARTIRPSHTLVDGDTLFTLTTNQIETDLNVLSMLASQVVEQAVLNAVRNATGVFQIPSYKDIQK
ncbi:P1 family peptidase [Virgibacillus necropolis]|uniref:Peptidase n=1 Tax=Virgibacillus necropolis TaxID=163877 RepID=A0A221MD83_9BACI|nr:P1 family peptidase [Virgibacillus necropolis]ASN05570.1 peptidase [Virgibacillus necropolis]